MFVVLCQPALVLIDYGHFQYNSVSLGLTLWGIVAVVKGWDVFGSMTFCLAINYKQMELYHSLPFFFYLLGKANISTTNKISFSLVIIKLGITVISTFGLCWIPFYIVSGTQGIFEIIARIFPTNRGIYEDKVASFWCSMSVVFKVRDLLPMNVLVWISVAVTLLIALPSLLNLVRKPTSYRFLLSLVSPMCT